jgi:ketosteroid isomerase-like protein
MSTDAARQLIDRYLAAYNTCDIPAMLALFDADCVFRNVSAGEVTVVAHGIDELRALAEQGAALFRHRQQTIREYAADGERVTLLIDFVGELTAELSPELRAGDTLRRSGRSIFTLRSGRIVELTDES